MKRCGLIVLLFAGIFLYSGCFTMENTYPYLAPGPWRAILQLDLRAAEKALEDAPDGTDDVELNRQELTEGALPFVFEVVYDNPEQFHIEIINGEERIRVDDIAVGKDRRVGEDTIQINFPVFDSYIRAAYEGNLINGYWVVKSKKDYKIPFSARFGEDYRFTTLRKTPAADLTGRWETVFSPLENPEAAIAEFEQKGNKLSGTFLTETGDYRFLEGTIQDDRLYLSTFDGAHAFLFEGTLLNDGSIVGIFRSGKHFKTDWKAVRNEEATLRSPDSLTYVKPDEVFDFSFLNTEGRMVSLKDSVFAGKPKIIQLMGTWCPNCRDETEFLKGYLAKSDKDIEVIALAFERYKEKESGIGSLAQV